MATNRASTANGTAAPPEKSYYEQQREMLVSEIAQVRLNANSFARQPITLPITRV